MGSEGLSSYDTVAFEAAWKAIRYEAVKEGEGDGWAIYDIDKSWPPYEPYYDCISNYCDWFYYWSDTAPWDIIRGKRATPYPVNKQDQAPKFTIEDLDKKLKENK